MQYLHKSDRLPSSTVDCPVQEMIGEMKDDEKGGLNDDGKCGMLMISDGDDHAILESIRFCIFCPITNGLTSIVSNSCHLLVY